MKTFINIVLVNVLFTLISFNARSQGCSADVQAVKYCADQYAEFIINEANPDVNYSWYSAAVGGNEYGYYNDRFASVFRVEDDFGPVSYWYSKELPVTLGHTTPSVGAQGGIDTYDPVALQFDAKSGLLINTVTFVSRIYYLDPNLSYTVSIVISDGTNDYYSEPITVNQFAFEQIGATQDYKIKIPVNIKIPAGTGYTMRIAERTPASTLLYALYPASSFSFPLNNDYATIYQSGFSANGVTAVPPYFDWDVTVVCPRTQVTSVQETNMMNCCTPIEEDIAIATTTTALVSPFEVDLLAVGSVFNNYKWYYEGNEIPGEEGVDNRYLTVNKLGRYEVRAVRELDDVEKVSCYKSDVIELTEKVLFASEDVEICLGESVNLSVKGAIGNIQWSPSEYFDDPNSVSPTVRPEQDMIFSVSATVPLGEGIINGSFDDAMHGFITDYQNVTESGTMNNQKYVIGNKVSNTAPTGFDVWAPCEARQGDGSNFMWLDAATMPNQRILEQTVPVEPNLEYDFSMWVTNIVYADNTVRDPADPGATPNIQIYINGSPVGGLYQHQGNVCVWKEHSFTWNSGPSTQAVIQIYETTMQNAENDFAIDDISFGRPGIQSDEVKVTVKNCLELTVSNDTTICRGDFAQLRAYTNGVFMKWMPEEAFPDQMANIQNVNPSETTTYSVETAYKLGNLIINGDFEQGLTQALSNGTDYNPVINAVNNVNVGSFTVGINPRVANQYFRTIVDHTSGSGNMFIADGSNEASKEVVYSTVVTVEAGMRYAFSAWIANIHNELNNPAELSFYVEDEKLGDLDALEDSDEWTNFYYIWESDIDGPITIYIRNENTNSQGNDFALDDLEFTPLSPYTFIEEITVTVEDCLPPVTDYELVLCEEENNSVSDVDITPYADSVRNLIDEHEVEWYYDLALTRIVANPTSQTITGPQTQFYAKVYSKSKNNYNTARLTCRVDPLPQISFPVMPVLCKSTDPYTIQGILPTGGTLTGDAIQSNGVFIPNTVGLNQISYTVTNSYGCTASAVSTIQVSEPEHIIFNQPQAICANTPTLDISSTVEPVSGALGTGVFVGNEISSQGLFSASSPGEYSVYYRFTNIYGCADSVQRLITVHELPVANITPLSNGICANSQLQLNGNPSGGTVPYNHSWNAAENVLDNAGIQSPVFSSANVGNFELTYTVTDNNGCIGTDIYNISVFGDPQITIEPVGPFCEYDKEVVVNAMVSPSGGTGSFSGGAITKEGVFDPAKAVISVNTVTYTYTDLLGCSNSATLEIVVNPKPDVTISAQDYACVNDNAFQVQANILGGTFVGSGINASGLFTPVNGQEGNNVVQYEYIDPQTGCADTAYKTIVLHPLPRPLIMSDDEFCSYDEIETFELSPFHASRSVIRGEGTRIIGGGAQFDPGLVAEGEHQITYVYTTEYGCTDSVSKQLIVHHTDVPIPHDAHGLITKDTKQIEKLSATITEIGSEIIWYNTDQDELSRDNPFNTGNETIGTTKYYVRQYLNGCYSDTVPAYLTIVSCPAPLPQVINNAICEGDNLVPVAAVHDTKYEIGWFPTFATEGTPMGDKAEYLPTSANLGDNEYWVAHFDTQLQCWGPSNRAVLTVHPNPVATITNIAPQYCDYDENIQALVSPQGGTLFINDSETNTMSFNPADLGPGDYTLRYDYTDVSTGCSDFDQVSFTVHHTDPPTGRDITHYLNRDLAFLPDLKAEGTDIRWYSDENANDFLKNGDSYKTGITDITPRTYFYYATQTLNGCESEPHKMRVHIVDCPTPAPDVDGYEICVYDPVQPLTATEALDWPEPKSGNGKMFWFSSEDAEDLDDTVTHMIHKGNTPFYPAVSTDGSYTFFVAEWDLGCLSPKTPVTVKLIKTEKPIISVTDVCQFGNGNTVTSKEYSTYWYSSPDLALHALASGYVLNFNTDNAGTQTFYATQLKNGCYSEFVPAAVSIIKKPEAPKIPVEVTEICEGSTNYHVLGVETYQESNVEWYALHNPQMISASVDLTKIPAGFVYEYNVRQDTTSLGCWSDYSSVYIDYVETPEKPRVLDPGKYCLGDELLPVSIDPLYLRQTGANDIRWYDSKNNFIASGNSYMPPNVDVAQTIDFKVQAFNRNCPSDILEEQLIVYEIPSVSISGPDRVCVNSGERIYIIENAKDEYTYEWSIASNASTIKPVLQGQENGGFNTYAEWTESGVDTLFCQTSYQGCVSYDTMVVYISPYPKINFEYDVFLNTGKTSFVNFTQETPIIDGNIIIEQQNINTWQFITSQNDTMYYNQPNEDVLNNIAFVQGGFTYGDNYALLHVVNEYGCAVDSMITFFNDMDATLFVPNCFAPDGPNADIRHFRPKGLNLEKYEVYIYDVWGTIIWHSNKLQHGQPIEGWDGMSEGKELKPDSYIWKIEATFKTGEVWKGVEDKKGKYSTMGTVNLIR